MPRNPTTVKLGRAEAARATVANLTDQLEKARVHYRRTLLECYEGTPSNPGMSQTALSEHFHTSRNRMSELIERARAERELSHRTKATTSAKK